VFVDQVNNPDNIALGSFDEICTDKSIEYEALNQNGNFIEYKDSVIIIKSNFF